MTVDHFAIAAHEYRNLEAELLNGWSGKSLEHVCSDFVRYWEPATSAQLSTNALRADRGQHLLRRHFQNKRRSASEIGI